MENNKNERKRGKKKEKKNYNLKKIWLVPRWADLWLKQRLFLSKIISRLNDTFSSIFSFLPYITSLSLSQFIHGFFFFFSATLSTSLSQFFLNHKSRKAKKLERHYDTHRHCNNPRSFSSISLFLFPFIASPVSLSSPILIFSSLSLSRVSRPTPPPIITARDQRYVNSSLTSIPFMPILISVRSIPSTIVIRRSIAAPFVIWFNVFIIVYFSIIIFYLRLSMGFRSFRFSFGKQYCLLSTGFIFWFDSQ